MARYDWEKETKSVPEHLIKNAKNYSFLASICFYCGFWAEQSHLGHICLELIYKAAYAKRNSNWHPFGHDLAKLCSKQMSQNETHSLFYIISQDSMALNYHSNMTSAWTMHDRYKRKVVSFETARMQYKAYKGLLKWMLKNCV